MGGVWQEPLLAFDRVRFVGEPVAIVLTDGTYAGEDVAELVSVDYEPLPAVPSIAAALADESLLFPDAGTNVCVRGGRPIGDDSIFDGCEVIVEGDVVNQRVAGAAHGGPGDRGGVQGREAHRLDVHPERPAIPADLHRHRAAA